MIINYFPYLKKRKLDFEERSRMETTEIQPSWNKSVERNIFLWFTQGTNCCIIKSLVVTCKIDMPQVKGYQICSAMSKAQYHNKVAAGGINDKFFCVWGNQISRKSRNLSRKFLEQTSAEKSSMKLYSSNTQQPGKPNTYTVLGHPQDYLTVNNREITNWKSCKPRCFKIVWKWRALSRNSTLTQLAS